MDYICKLCGVKIEGNAHFWDEHRQKISDYFHQHEPRLTLDGQNVIFKKSIEGYFETDFNDLNSRRTWAKQNPEAARTYFINLLLKRKQKKNWIYAPGQTLLTLSNLPKIAYFEKSFNKTFGEICGPLGFKVKYTNNIPKVNWSAGIEVIIDTREQLAWQFPSHVSSIVKKLEYGDVCLSNDTKISIERKSLSDLVNTLSSGFERFKREINRAKEDRGYLVILCESSLNDLKSIEYLPQTKHSKCSWDFISKRARDLHEEFDNFQMVFSNGRKHAVTIAEFILKLGKRVKKIDLQLLVDSKLI